MWELSSSSLSFKPLMRRNWNKFSFCFLNAPYLNFTVKWVCSRQSSWGILKEVFLSCSQCEPGPGVNYIFHKCFMLNFNLKHVRTRTALYTTSVACTHILPLALVSSLYAHTLSLSWVAICSHQSSCLGSPSGPGTPSVTLALHLCLSSYMFTQAHTSGIEAIGLIIGLLTSIKPS